MEILSLTTGCTRLLTATLFQPAFPFLVFDQLHHISVLSLLAKFSNDIFFYKNPFEFTQISTILIKKAVVGGWRADS